MTWLSAGCVEELTIEAKADGSFVTEVDKHIETTLRSRLAERFPDHDIVGEEYGSAVGASATRWYLDPIDGTHNYMRGVPLFGTLIAAERDGEIQVGVISAPALGQRWWASRGEGAWTVGGGRRERRRLHVSERADLAVAQVLFRSVTDMHASQVADGFDALLPTVWRERGFGDFWGYALVADGAAEAMMERDLGPWDLAAPWIIVEEAGGRITDFDGRRSFAAGRGPRDERPAARRPAGPAPRPHRRDGAAPDALIAVASTGGAFALPAHRGLDRAATIVHTSDNSGQTT